MTTRADIVRVARSYIGTPYVLMGRQPGYKIDCAGVIVCCARDIGAVAADFDIEPYTSNLAGPPVLETLDGFMGDRILSSDQLQMGDCVAVKFSRHPQHVGIVGDYKPQAGLLTLIHATNGTRPAQVVEHRLTFDGKMTFVMGYKFKGVIE
jgi:hypothetical protein